MSHHTDPGQIRLTPLTDRQKRRAGLVCAEFAIRADATDDLGRVLQMLDLKPSPEPTHEKRNEYGRAK